ncbi:type III secretion system stator protein SctL [Pseudomonas sp. ChxA]|uniref:type III secretion system stator protein SctL n=1 Tax=Pseudomonas sp. ChxA TaxID=3035473 RepID=UPI002552BDDA|nr:type III secretion system stator protein SctL [Pseudomonas sp. ChxA]MDL2186479.1 type III secretion system stator protein SctL [Pseudomonas sp. ChxA]
MLVRRTLSLGDQHAAPVGIVRHEQFRDSQAAVDLLAQAREQAEALLLEAQQQRQQVIDQASAQFWEDAGAFLQGIETQAQAAHNHVVQAARQLLNQAIERLFGECTLGERAQALITHLAAGQSHATGATLSCHPQVFAQVQAWVASSRFAALWQLREDGAMPIDALRLSNDAGEFDLDWASLQRCMLAPGG